MRGSMAVTFILAVGRSAVRSVALLNRITSCACGHAAKMVRISDEKSNKQPSSPFPSHSHYYPLSRNVRDSSQLDLISEYLLVQCCAPNPSLAPSLPFLPAVSWLLYLLTYVERGDITGEKERRVLGEGTERRKEGRWHGSIPPPPHPAIVSQREEQRSPFCLSSPTVVSRGIRIAQLSPPFFSFPKKRLSSESRKHAPLLFLLPLSL